MIRFKVLLSVIFISSLFFVLAAESVLAQSQGDEPGQSGISHGLSFGKGQPKSIRELPPGQLRKDLEGLPAKAQGKALGWLQEFSFPAEDVKNLRVSADGSIHYADTFLPAPADVDSMETLSTESAMSASKVFQLHSRPGASNVVFLDFDGHTMTGTAWNYYGEAILVALPFDPSQNDSPATVANFTQDELNRIAEIWHRMAEDFAAFDIDVTTEEPAVFTPTTGRVLFTHDVDANGFDMPSKNAGGVAYVNAFGRSDYVSMYSPALVYYTNLYSSSYGSPTLNAEAGSHEFGHNIGLSHDGVVGGSSYYSGHGNGLVDWGPIMGSSYSRNVTQWSAGDYPNANNQQDDMSILAGDLGYVADEHSDSQNGATPIRVEANGDILVSSPEYDPDNVLIENKGVINDRSDVDWFYIDITAAGNFSLTATPAWHSFTRNDLRGSNLDIELTLFNSNLTMLELADPDDNTSASINTSLSPGRYYIQVNGVGNNTNSSYSDYSSLGMFFLEGSVQVGDVDQTPPSPSTMAWQTTPYATGENSISMTAVQATDDSGNVEYYFSCVSGGNGCTDSGWQSGRTWSPSGLDASTYYSYKVRARDVFGNPNTFSSAMGDTTDEPAPPPAENYAPIAVATYTPTPPVITQGKTVTVKLSASGSYDPDGVIFAWEWQDSNGSTLSTSMAYDTRLEVGSHNFTLTVTDNDGASNSANVTVSVTKGGGDDGGGKKCNPRKQACG